MEKNRENDMDNGITRGSLGILQCRAPKVPCSLIVHTWGRNVFSHVTTLVPKCILLYGPFVEPLGTNKRIPQAISSFFYGGAVHSSPSQHLSYSRL